MPAAAAAAWIVFPSLIFFLSNLTRFSTAGFCWEGNHSLHCYLRAHGVQSTYRHSAVLLLGFAAAAAVLYVRVLRGRDVPASRFSVAEISLIGMAFVLMSLVPNVSHDYKLPIQVVPFLLLVSATELDLGTAGWERRIGFPIIAGAQAFLFAPGPGLRTPFLLALFAAYAALFAGQLRGRVEDASVVAAQA